MRFVNHTLTIDPDAEQNLAHAWCMSCGERSPETAEKDSVQEWCLKHSGRTHHTSYRAVITNYFVVRPTEGTK